MKVYDYLTITTNDKIDECLKFSSYMLETYGDYDLRDFYNQPFTPELITKYFKGWMSYWTNPEESDERLFYNEKYQIIIEYESMCIHKKDDDSIVQVIYPLTLNDFIRDCFRTKIELEM